VIGLEKVIIFGIVDQKESDKISNLFQKIYSFTATEFPLGIVMRFIPHFLRVKQDKHQKIIKWRNKQKCFLEGIEAADRPMTATSWEILHLDKYVDFILTNTWNTLVPYEKI
jgi:hypothetical protein